MAGGRAIFEFYHCCCRYQNNHCGSLDSICPGSSHNCKTLGIFRITLCWNYIRDRTKGKYFFLWQPEQTHLEKHDLAMKTFYPWPYQQLLHNSDHVPNQYYTPRQILSNTLKFGQKHPIANMCFSRGNSWIFSRRSVSLWTLKFLSEIQSVNHMSPTAVLSKTITSMTWK